MAKFVYRMQNILEIKYKIESQAKSHYSNMQAKLNEEQEKLEASFSSMPPVKSAGLQITIPCKVFGSTIIMLKMYLSLKNSTAVYLFGTC